MSRGWVVGLVVTAACTPKLRAPPPVAHVAEPAPVVASCGVDRPPTLWVERAGEGDYAHACDGLDRAACEDQCVNGHGMACVALGNDPRFELDEAGKIAVFRRGCALGSALGCTNLGAAFGLATPPDDRCANELFALACQAHEAYGCAMLGFHRANGRGLPFDGERAVAEIQRGCDAGLIAHQSDSVQFACQTLVVAYDHGLGDDLTRAARRADARAIGCAAGDAAACDPP